MKEILGKVLCFLGIHKWELSRPVGVMDIFPPPTARYKNPTRECQRCGKAQWWLPGYGGSEIGCWCPGRRT